MKYLIFSDIHGSLYYTSKIIDVFNEQKCDKMIILGDVLYHGPRNDLPKEYNPKGVFALLNQYKDKIICIRGNCDAEVDQMVLDFKINDDMYLKDNIYLTHGHHINPLNPLKTNEKTIILYGHTHIHNIEKVNKDIYINPGSISIPKSDNISSFAILENDTIIIYDFSMNELLKYDLKKQI